MEAPSVLFIESYAISLVSIGSLYALVSYAFALKHGFPKQGFGKSILNSIFTLNRLGHIVLLVICFILFIVFGLLEGSSLYLTFYGFKIYLLLINVIFTYLMTYHKINVENAAPIVVATWTTLGVIHLYYLIFDKVQYLTTLLFIHIMFILLIFIIFTAFKMNIKSTNN